MLWLIIDVVLVIAIIMMLFYPRWNLRRNAKVVENEEFNRLMMTSQILDIREANQYRVKHILGARNIAAAQIDSSLNAISTHKPVLIYENAKPIAAAKVAKKLKKAGVPEIYILKNGLNGWDGKVKEGA
ncbi:rhodanese-like domain-containing protein [Lactococcus hircilactis]|uniref:Rhodanese-like domain-containing protein n=1 Tax=Lactococcus hircilactis TaxID=1494462 RepID=A0A7X1ZBE6_9LACT|nr:rhodanese-like domain-containing protein [Lactococcus hircilactis]MQW40217.1 rhodanese-like domain-containing protein [Lactococcus hircilactis]